jgi:hypothetical protein
VTVMDKLLVPAAMQRVVEQGYDHLAGAVVRSDDHVGKGAAERVAAFGLDGDRFPFGADPEHVDVIRFVTNPLMQLSIPTDVGEERPWPTYPFGFLRDATPVWDLDLTRVPMGARFVRVAADGSESILSEYGGAGWGWQRAKGYFPPLHVLGPRAKWQGLDLPASYTEDQQSVELVWVGEDGVPEGFTPSRPRVHVRTVPVAECDAVFEVVLTSTWRDVPVRVLQQAGDEALVVLLDPDLERIDRTGARPMDVTLFQATAPVAELGEVTGVVREPAFQPLTAREH